MEKSEWWPLSCGHRDVPQFRIIFPPPTPKSGDFYCLNLVEKEKSLLRKPDSPYQGSESPGNCSGSGFFPDQVLLSKNFCSRPGKSLVRNSGVGGGGENLILTNEGNASSEAQSGLVDEAGSRVPSSISWDQKTSARIGQITSAPQFTPFMFGT